jgi:hypothetical protein
MTRPSVDSAMASACILRPAQYAATAAGSTSSASVESPQRATGSINAVASASAIAPGSSRRMLMPPSPAFISDIHSS